jgi:nucleoside-diphosphate-sugar epimerase
MDTATSCLIVGCGYVGARFARQQAARRPLLAVVRSAPSEAALRAAGIPTMRLDFDHEGNPAQVDPGAGAPTPWESLAAAAQGSALVYLVPPAEHGGSSTDARLERFLVRLGPAVPAAFVYVSTTGVYGDTSGATVDETAALAPGNDRSRRRVAAEYAATAWCAARGVRCVILRVPGIYGPHRLPLERLRRSEPALRMQEAGPGNRIHVDDLVACIVAAIDRRTAQGPYNVTDGDHSSTTTYLLETAAAAGLPAPRLVTMAEARALVSPGMLAYLAESRRVANVRMLSELGVQLLYPTVQAGIRASLAEMRTEESNA